MAAFTQQQWQFFNSGFVSDHHHVLSHKVAQIFSIMRLHLYRIRNSNSNCAAHLFIIGCLYIKGQKNTSLCSFPPFRQLKDDLICAV